MTSDELKDTVRLFASRFNCVETEEAMDEILAALDRLEVLEKDNEKLRKQLDCAWGLFTSTVDGEIDLAIEIKKLRTRVQELEELVE